MHILIDISGKKDNQALKFSQLIKYNIKNNFLERSYTKYGGETIPISFYEKSKLSISPDQ